MAYDDERANGTGIVKALALSAVFWIVVYNISYAQEAQPARDELFWCKNYRNFMADSAQSNAASASKLEEESAKLKAKITELESKLAEATKEK